MSQYFIHANAVQNITKCHENASAGYFGYALFLIKIGG